MSGDRAQPFRRFLRCLVLASALTAAPVLAEDAPAAGAGDAGAPAIQPSPDAPAGGAPSGKPRGEPFEQPTPVRPVVEVDRPHRRRDPNRDPERPRLVEDEALVMGMIGAGSENRNDGALVVKRRDGQLVDGFGGVEFRRSEHTPHETMLRMARLTAGTDPLTAREGRFMWDASLEQGAWRGPLTLYDVSAHGGRSVDRRTLLGADVVASILHFGIERDEHVRSYAIGVCFLGSPDIIPVRLTIDRVISYIDGQRFYATEARLRVPFVLEEHLLIYLEGAHLRHGVDAIGRSENVWEGFAGIGLLW